jgi:hypothetical protein
MNQPTSIQILDAAIWQVLGGEKAHDAAAGRPPDLTWSFFSDDPDATESWSIKLSVSRRGSGL